MRTITFIASPVTKFIRLYAETLAGGRSGTRNFFFLFLGLALGWWVYVPAHELLHAAGCMLGGGSVTKLEIQATYGGQVLSQIFPFVRVGGDYAGRLSGFETGNSDLIYALTVYFPFLFSLLGFPALVWAARKKSNLFLGLVVPWAGAPVVSITGDFLELGTLLLFQLWPGPVNIHRLLISDDLFRLIQNVRSGAIGVTAHASTVIFVFLGLTLGTFMAWATLKFSEILSAFIADSS